MMSVGDPIIIDNGDAGFSTQGSWTSYSNSNLPSYKGTSLYSSPGTGLDKATWLFTNLEPGIYTVHTAWSNASNRATNAPFTVRDVNDNRDLGTYTIDQTLAPDDLTEAGTSWEKIGTTFEVRSDSFSVTLTDIASANVFADGMRIQRMDDLAANSPEIQISDAFGIVLNDGGVIDFGTLLAEGEASRVLTVKNMGTATLMLDAPVVSGAFSLSSALGKTSLEPGETTTFTVAFDSTDLGARTGGVLLDSNDANESDLQISLNALLMDPAIIIDNDETGFSTVGGWTFYDLVPAVDYHGSSRYSSAGTGADKATWTFTKLEPGIYTIHTTWNHNNNRATNAPFTITDSSNGHSFGTVSVNQTIAPGGLTESGTNWKQIGTTFEVRGDSLAVMLTDNANGTVFADAVRIQRIDELPAMSPEIQITDASGTTLTPGGTWDWGGKVLTESTINRVLTVKNMGTGTLTLDTPNLSGAVTLVSGLGKTSLEPGESTTFTVGLNVTSLGNYTGGISVGSNDADEGAAQTTVNTAVVDPAIIIDNDETGFSTVGGWTFYDLVPAVDYHGSSRYSSAGTGADKATWTFTKLEPGIYTIHTTWNHNNNRATNSPFTITELSNEHLFGTIPVNQTIAPGGLTESGTNWKQIGTTFEVRGDSLAVMLTDNANGTVFADAVRIQRVSDLPAASGPKITKITWPTTLGSNGPTKFLVTFDSAINPTTLTWQDLSLTRNGGSNLITSGSGITITEDTVTPNTYIVEVDSSLRYQPGNYTITVHGAGVTDLSDTPFENSRTSQYTTELKATGASWPSTMTTAGPSKFAITFNAEIDIATLTWQDIELKRNSGANLITSGTGISISKYDQTPNSYIVLIDSSLRSLAGNYAFTIRGAGVSTTDGYTSINDLTNTYTVAPQVSSLTNFTAPIATPVTSITVKFNQASNPSTFTWEDISITRNGGSNLATSDIVVTPSATDPLAYTITIPSSITEAEGDYEFTVLGAGIQTDTGAAFSNNLSTKWGMHLNIAGISWPSTMTTVGPSKFAITFNAEIDIATLTWQDIDLTRNGGSDLITSATGITISKYDQTPNTYIVLIDSSLRWLAGDYAFTIHGAGIATTNGFTASNDLTRTYTVAPQVSSLTTFTVPVATPVTSITVKFNQASTASTFNWQDLSITRNGGSNLATSDIVVTPSTTDPLVYTVTMPSSITQTEGTYQFTVLGAGIQTDTSAAFTTDRSTSWTMQPAISNTSEFSTPQTAPITAIAVRFHTQINASTFDWHDITLTRNGGSNLADSTVTVAQSSWDPMVYVITIPLSMTQGEGNYALTVTGSGIASTSGTAFANSKTTSWTMRPAISNTSEFSTPQTAPITAIAVRFYTQINASTFDWHDITLTRNGGSNLADSTVTVAQSSWDPMVYVITIPLSMTQGEGNYALTVTGSGIASTSGTAFANSKTTSWTMQPAISNMSAFADPRTTPVTGTAIRFYSQINAASFTWHDITLTRDGGPNLSSTDLIITQSLTDPLVYVINIPSSLTQPAGKYALTVAGATIQSASNAAFANNGQSTWTMYGTASGLTTFPDPRTTSVTGIAVTFTTAINPSTFDWNDLVLTRDGGSNLVTSAFTITPHSTNPLAYIINIPSSLTQPAGDYALSVTGSGITTTAGTAIANNGQSTWTMLGTASGLTTFPAPRTTPVTGVAIMFTTAIDAATFNWQDITLTRDGGSNLATSDITITPHATNPLAYIINIPSALTQATGDYVLTATGSGITTTAGTAIANNGQTSWTIHALASALTSFPDPRTSPVTGVAVLFTNAIDAATFNWQDIVLTRDGGSNLATSAITVTPVAGAPLTYLMTIPSSLTSIAGNYTLSVTGADITASGGHAIANNGQTTWTMLPSLAYISTFSSSVTSPVAYITQLFYTQIDAATFNHTDITLTRDGASVATDGITITQSGSNPLAYSINLPSAMVQKAGVYELTVNASGIQTASGTSFANNKTTSWTMLPTISLMNNYPTPRTDSVYNTGVTLSEPINLSTFTWQDLTLTRNGVPVTLSSAVVITQVGSTSNYNISIPGPLTAPSGSYELTVTGSGIATSAGTVLANSMSTTWTMLPAVLALGSFAAPQTSPVLAVSVSINDTLAGSTFTLDDVTLTRNGVNIPLTSPAYVEQSWWDPFIYVVRLPAGMTQTEGNYQLTVTGSGIQTATGTALASTKSSTWTMLPVITSTSTYPTPTSSAVTSTLVSFNTTLDLSTFTYNDLTATLNGTPISNLSGITIQAAVGQPAGTYQINLPNAIAYAYGDLVLNITGSGIKSSSGASVANNASITWTRAPIFQTLNVAPETMTYPKTVIGFQATAELDLATLSWADIQLTLDGGPNIATDEITFARTSPTSLWYTITLPAALTKSSGTYQITLIGTAVNETTGEAFSNSIAGSWVQTYNLAQINQFPTPAVGAKTLIGFQSSVELNLSSMTWADVELTRNGGSNLATSAIYFTHVPDSLWYVANIPASLTTSEGDYQIKIKGTGMLDTYGHALGNDMTTTWSNRAVINSMTSFASPQSSPVASIIIETNTALNLTTFTSSDITLKRDGTSITTTGITVQAAGAGYSATSYKINIPSSIDAAVGNYELILTGSGIQATNGFNLSNNISTTWTQAQALIGISTFPTPRVFSPATIDVVANTALDLATFDWNDLSLTLNGGANLIDSSVTITPLGSNTYRISLPEALSPNVGNYVLTVNGSNIKTTGGDALSNNATTTWTTKAQYTWMPTYAAPRVFSPTSVDVIANTELDLATLDWNDLSLTLNGGTNLIDSSVTITHGIDTLGHHYYSINLPEALTPDVGTYILTVNGADVLTKTGAPVTNNFSTTWTTKAQYTWMPTYAAPRVFSPTSVDVIANTELDLATLDWNDLSLTLNGGTNLIDSSVTITHGIDTLGHHYYSINLPEALTPDVGTYVLTINGADVLTKTGVPVTNNFSTTWTTKAQYTWIQTFPAPNITSPATVDFISNTPLNLATLDWHDLNLTLNGNATNLIDFSVTITSIGTNTYRVHLPSALTSAVGNYSLTVSGNNVVDTAGNSLVNNITTTWTHAAKFTQITQFPVPLTSPQTWVTVQTDSPINLATFTWQDIQLTLDSGPNLASAGIQIEKMPEPENTYKILLPPSLTYSAGAYSITINGAGISTTAGTPINNVTTQWVSPEAPKFNTAPIAFAQIYSLPHSKAFTSPFSVLGNAIDPQDDSIQAELIAPTKHGQITWRADGTFDYIPNKGYVGTDAFTFVPLDLWGNYGDHVVVELNIINDAPQSPRLTYYVTDSSLAITLPEFGLLGSTYDAQGDSLKITLVPGASPQLGTLVLNEDGTFTYTRFSGINTGIDGFEFTISDGTEIPTEISVRLVIAASPDSPAANDDNVTFAHGKHYASGAGSLLDNDSTSSGPLKAILVSGPSTGTLDFHSDGRFEFTPSGNNLVSASFYYKTIDHLGNESALAKVTLTPTNHAPLAIENRFAIAVGQKTRIIMEDLLADDFDFDGDELSLISVTSPAHGTLTLVSAGVWDYLPSGAAKDDSFTYTISDGFTQQSGKAVLAPFNLVPIAKNIAYETNQGANLIVGTADGLVAQASDPEGQTLTAQLTNGSLNGSVTLASNGSFTYVPNPGFFGTDWFTYTVSDGENKSDVYTVQITVKNIVPSGAADAFTLLHGSKLAISKDFGVLANDTAPTGVTITAELVTGKGPAHGGLNLLADGSFTYTPSSVGYVGSDSFVYRPVNAHYEGGELVKSYGAEVTVELTIENQAPTVIGENYQITQTTTIAKEEGVLANDFDPDSDKLTVSIIDIPSYGELTLNSADGSFTFIPKAGYTGQDVFTYKVSDGVSADDQIVVVFLDIQASAVPEPVVDYYETSRSKTLTILPVNGVLANDSPSESTTAKIFLEPSHGNLTFGSNGALAYAPEAGFIGTDTFYYQTYNGYELSLPIPVTIQVINSAPQASSLSLNTNEDQALESSASLLNGASDADGDTLDVIIIDQPSNGTLAIDSQGKFKYTPAENFHGADSFTYAISDGAQTSQIQTVALNVASVDDAPVLALPALNLAVGGTLTLTQDQLNSYITNIEGSPVSLVLVSGPAHGSVSLSPFSYTPSASYVGNDSFSVAITNGTSTSAPMTVNITVENHPPVITAPHYYFVSDQPALTSVQSGLAAFAHDAEGHPLTFHVVTPPSVGTLTLAANGSFTYAAPTGYTGTVTFDAAANDGFANSQTVLVSMVFTAAPPVLRPEQYYVRHDQPLTVEARLGVMTNDILKTPGYGAQSFGSASHGSVSLNTNGGFTFTPEEGFVGQAGFSYILTNGTDQTDPVFVAVNITNTPVHATNDTYDIHAGSVLVVTAPSGPLVNDYDHDGDVISALNIVQDVTNGSLHWTQGGFSYAPNPGFTGIDTFSYEVTDGVTIDVATVTIRVVNFAPEAHSQNLTTQHDVSVKGNFLAGAFDADGDHLTVVVTPDITKGTYTAPGSNGEFTYTPKAGFTGRDTIVYKLFDGQVYSPEVSIAIDVTNAAPITTDFRTAIHWSTTDVTGNLLWGSFDTDIKDAELKIEKISEPQWGYATIQSSGFFQYIPDTSKLKLGNDSFAFRVTDGAGATAIGVVTIALTDNTPIAVPDATIVDTRAGSVVVDITANDTDLDGDSFKPVIVANTGSGQITASIDKGKLNIVPVPGGRAGFYEIVYKLAQPTGSQTVYSKTATVTVLLTDNTFGANNDHVVVVTNQATTADLKRNDSLPGAFNWTYSLKTPSDADKAHFKHAEVSSSGVLTFEASNYVGELQLQYEANNGEGTIYTGNILIDILSTDPMRANDDSFDIAMNSSTTYPLSKLTANDTNADGSTYISGLVLPQHGEFDLETYTYTPNPNYLGYDTFSYILVRGDSISNEATVTLKITHQAPTATPVTLPELKINDAGYFSVNYNQAILDSITAYDNTTKDYIVITPPLYGNLNTTYNIYHIDDTFGKTTDYFYFIPKDSSGVYGTTPIKATIIIPNSGKALSITASADYKAIVISQNTTSTELDVLANDFLSGQTGVVLSVQTDAEHGKAKMVGGKITYTPNAGFFGTDKFQYTINIKNKTSTAWGYINVLAEPKPTVTNRTLTVNEGSTITFDVSEGFNSNITDSSTLKYWEFNTTSISSGNAIAQGNSITFDPGDIETSHDVVISYTLYNALWESVEGTTTIHVNAVNDAPIMKEKRIDIYSVPDGKRYKIDLSSQISDVDSDFSGLHITEAVQTAGYGYWDPIGIEIDGLSVTLVQPDFFEGTNYDGDNFWRQYRVTIADSLGATSYGYVTFYEPNYIYYARPEQPYTQTLEEGRLFADGNGNQLTVGSDGGTGSVTFNPTDYSLTFSEFNNETESVYINTDNDKTVKLIFPEGSNNNTVRLTVLTPHQWEQSGSVFTPYPIDLEYNTSGSLVFETAGFDASMNITSGHVTWREHPNSPGTLSVSITGSGGASLSANKITGTIDTTGDIDLAAVIFTPTTIKANNVGAINIQNIPSSMLSITATGNIGNFTYGSGDNKPGLNSLTLSGVNVGMVTMKGIKTINVNASNNWAGMSDPASFPSLPTTLTADVKNTIGSINAGKDLKGIIDAKFVSTLNVPGSLLAITINAAIGDSTIGRDIINTTVYGAGITGLLSVGRDITGSSITAYGDLIHQVKVGRGILNSSFSTNFTIDEIKALYLDGVTIRALSTVGSVTASGANLKNTGTGFNSLKNVTIQSIFSDINTINAAFGAQNSTISALGTISNIDIASSGPGDFSGSITGGTIGTVHVNRGKFTGNINGMVNSSTISTAILAYGDIKGNITLNNKLSSLYSSTGAYDGNIDIKNYAIGNISMPLDIKGEIKSELNIGDITSLYGDISLTIKSKSGSVGTIWAGKNVDVKVNALHDLGSIFSGNIFGGSISAIVDVGGGVGDIFASSQPYLINSPYIGDIVVPRRDIVSEALRKLNMQALRDIAPFIRPPNGSAAPVVSGGNPTTDVLKIKLTLDDIPLPDLGIAGNISGSFKTGPDSHIHSIKAYGNLTANVTTGTVDSQIWALGNVNSTLTASQSAVDIYAWGNIAGEINAPANIGRVTLHAGGDSNTKVTAGSHITIDAWGSVSNTLKTPRDYSIVSRSNITATLVSGGTISRSAFGTLSGAVIKDPANKLRTDQAKDEFIAEGGQIVLAASDRLYQNASIKGERVNLKGDKYQFTWGRSTLIMGHEIVDLAGGQISTGPVTDFGDGRDLTIISGGDININGTINNRGFIDIVAWGNVNGGTIVSKNLRPNDDDLLVRVVAGGINQLNLDSESSIWVNAAKNITNLQTHTNNGHTSVTAGESIANSKIEAGSAQILAQRDLKSTKITGDYGVDIEIHGMASEVEIKAKNGGVSLKTGASEDSASISDTKIYAYASIEVVAWGDIKNVEFTTSPENKTGKHGGAIGVMTSGSFQGTISSERSIALNAWGGVEANLFAGNARTPSFVGPYVGPNRDLILVLTNGNVKTGSSFKNMNGSIEFDVGGTFDATVTSEFPNLTDIISIEYGNAQDLAIKGIRGYAKGDLKGAFTSKRDIIITSGNIFSGSTFESEAGVFLVSTQSVQSSTISAKNISIDAVGPVTIGSMVSKANNGGSFNITSLTDNVSITSLYSKCDLVNITSMKNTTINVVTTNPLPPSGTDISSYLPQKINIFALGVVSGNIKALGAIDVVGSDGVAAASISNVTNKSVINVYSGKTITTANYNSKGKLTVGAKESIEGSFASAQELEITAGGSFKGTADSGSSLAVFAEQVIDNATSLKAKAGLVLTAGKSITAKIEAGYDATVTSITQGITSASFSAGGTATLFAKDAITATTLSAGKVVVFTPQTLSGSITSTILGIDVTALEGSSAALDSNWGVDMLVSDSSGVVKAKYDINLSAYGEVSKSVTSIFGKVDILAIGGVTGAVSGFFGVDIVAGDIGVTDAIASASGSVSIFSEGVMTGDITDAGDISVIAFGQSTGSWAARKTVAATFHGTRNGDITSVGKIQIVAMNGLAGYIQATGSGIYDNIKTVVTGENSATIFAQKAVEVFTLGKHSGQITSISDSVTATVLGDLTGSIIAGQYATLTTSGQVKGGASGNAGITVRAGGDVSGLISSDQGAVSLTTAGKLSSEVKASTQLDITAAGQINSTAISSTLGSVNILGYDNIAITSASGHDWVKVTALGNLTGAFKSTAASVTTSASGTAAITVNAATIASVSAFGDAKVEVTAGELASIASGAKLTIDKLTAPSAQALALDDLAAKNATISGDLVLLSNNQAAITASTITGKLTVIASNNAATTTISADVGQLFVVSAGDIQINASTAQDDSVISSMGKVDVDIDASGSLTITAAGDVNTIDAFKASGPLHIESRGQITGTIKAESGASTLWALGDISADIQAPNDFDSITTYGNFTGAFNNTILTGDLSTLTVLGNVTSSAVVNSIAPMVSVAVGGVIAGALTPAVTQTQGDAWFYTGLPPDLNFQWGPVDDTQSLQSVSAAFAQLDVDLAQALARLTQAKNALASSLAATAQQTTSEIAYVISGLTAENQAIGAQAQRLFVSLDQRFADAKTQINAALDVQSGLVVVAENIAAAKADHLQLFASYAFAQAAARVDLAQRHTESVFMGDEKLSAILLEKKLESIKADHEREIASNISSRKRDWANAVSEAIARFDAAADRERSRNTDDLQTTLTLASLAAALPFPLFSSALDLLNGSISLARGNYWHGTLCLVGALPLLGIPFKVEAKAAQGLLASEEAARLALAEKSLCAAGRRALKEGETLEVIERMNWKCFVGDTLVLIDPQFLTGVIESAQITGNLDAPLQQTTGFFSPRTGMIVASLLLLSTMAPRRRNKRRGLKGDENLVPVGEPGNEKSEESPSLQGLIESFGSESRPPQLRLLM